MRRISRRKYVTLVGLIVGVSFYLMGATVLQSQLSRISLQTGVFFEENIQFSDILPKKAFSPNSDKDRIVHQMEYGEKVKELVSDHYINSKVPSLLNIYTRMEAPPGQTIFINHGCPVNNCSIVKKDATPIHAMLSKSGFGAKISDPDVITILYQLESPAHSSMNHKGVNWTATYRRDSTIVTPYEKFVFYDNFTGFPERPYHDYAKGKTKLVAWFVSNCAAPNGRSTYVKELSKYLNVDIYGNCGPLKCTRKNKTLCYQMLSNDYKFYLSFENSNCRDYITEKLYWNALSNDVVPVVMGAHPDDYHQVAPPYSYIHVDDFESPKELAEYLLKLDKDDHLYNQYFRWKGTGHFINTKFWCRLCTMLHAARLNNYVTWYDDLSKWWSGPDICIGRDSKEWATWRNYIKNETMQP